MTVITQREMIHGLRRKVGLLRYQPCTVVFENGTMLVADCDKTTSSEDLAARYDEMTVEQILAEREGNFEIPANQVERVRVERVGGDGLDTSGGPDRLILKTLLGKKVFVFTGRGTGAAQAKEILARRFGHRVL